MNHFVTFRAFRGSQSGSTNAGSFGCLIIAIFLLAIATAVLLDQLRHRDQRIKSEHVSDD